MRIYATFVNFKDFPDACEMIHAWDEFTVDNNHPVYESTLQEALASYGDTLLNKVSVVLEVDEKQIKQLLGPELTLPVKVVQQ